MADKKRAILIQDELERRLTAFVPVEDQEGFDRELSFLCDRQEEIFGDAAKSIWESRTSFPPPNFAKSAKATVKDVTTERIQRQRQMLYLKESALSKSAAKHIQQMEAGISPTEPADVTRMLREHFADQIETMHIARTQYMRFLTRHGGSQSLQSPKLRQQLLYFEFCIADLTARQTRLGGRELKSKIVRPDQYGWTKLSRGSWQVMEGDMRALARARIIEHVVEKDVRAFYMRVMWLPYSHSQHLYRRFFEVLRESEVIAPLIPGNVPSPEAVEHRFNQPPMLSSFISGVDSQLENLKIFFGIEASYRSNRLGVFVEQLLARTFPTQRALRQVRLNVSAHAESVEKVVREEEEDTSNLSPESTKESFVDDAESAALLVDLHAAELEAHLLSKVSDTPVASAAFPLVVVDDVLRSENSFVDEDDLREATKRINELVRTHWARAKLRDKEPEKEDFVMFPPKLASPSDGPKEKEEPAGPEDENGAPDPDAPKVPSRTLYALYALRLLRTRGFKLRVLHALNAMTSMRCRLMADMVAEEALEDLPGVEGFADLLETLESHPLVGLRVLNGEGQHVLHRSAMQAFRTIQEDCLRLASHCLEVLQKQLQEQGRDEDIQ
eukprot:gene20681-24785_t